jgi:pimeloyl-ACP methyl ester carboxylesterase
MHGVLGAGHNLRSFAKRLTERRPELRLALIDLRYHGKSVGAPAPHGLASCVDDLFDLVDHLGRAPAVVLGHSLGGKVALTYGRRHEDPRPAARTPRPEQASALRQIWTLDSDPGAQAPDDSHEVEQVMGALRLHPGPFESRKAAVDAIMSEGRSSGLAQWLATSLDRKSEGYTWRFDLPEIEILLADYFAIDEWPFLEGVKTRESAIQYELLLAENSDRWSGSMKDRAQHLSVGPRVRVHTLPDSGHWVHVDNPEGLLDIVSAHLLTTAP